MWGDGGGYSDPLSSTLPLPSLGPRSTGEPVSGINHFSNHHSMSPAELRHSEKSILTTTVVPTRDNSRLRQSYGLRPAVYVGHDKAMAANADYGPPPMVHIY